MRESRIRTLVLYAQYTTKLSYYDDWLDAFLTAPCLAVTSINICSRNSVRRLRQLVHDVELIVLLHSTNADSTSYLEPLATVLLDRKGLLVSFVGNEVNIPVSPMTAKRRVLGETEPDIIATQLPLEAGEYLFGDLVRWKVIGLSHGLNPRVFRPTIPQAARTIDIGVRAGRYLPHLGDDDRNRLHDYFAAHDFDPSLIVDIGTEKFTRDKWAAFLNRCRGTVSCESASWYLERDDATIEAIRAYAAQRIASKGLKIAYNSPLRRLANNLPLPVRRILRAISRWGPILNEVELNETLPFNETYERFFEGKPRCPVYSKCISSRHFDAIGTGTVQIMLPGRYNDILTADRHYIELAPDYSNIKEVMERYKDVSYREAIAREAYQYVMEDHTYDKRIESLREAIESH